MSEVPDPIPPSSVGPARYSAHRRARVATQVRSVSGSFRPKFRSLCFAPKVVVAARMLQFRTKSA